MTLPVALRSEKISHTLGGGLRAFATKGAQIIHTSGVSFSVADQPYIVYARLTCFCTDGDGTKQALNLTGASGVRPCVRCPNAF